VGGLFLRALTSSSRAMTARRPGRQDTFRAAAASARTYHRGGCCNTSAAPGHQGVVIRRVRPRTTTSSTDVLKGPTGRGRGGSRRRSSREKSPIDTDATDVGILSEEGHGAERRARRSASWPGDRPWLAGQTVQYPRRREPVAADPTARGGWRSRNTGGRSGSTLPAADARCLPRCSCRSGVVQDGGTPNAPAGFASRPLGIDRDVTGS